MRFANAFSAYKEFIKTGGVQCTAEGDFVLLDVRGNLTGDILLFIGPKNKTVSDATDIYELIRTDTALTQQHKAVLKSLSQKYKGISLLPKSLVWIIDTVILAVYADINSNYIREALAGGFNLKAILVLLPLVLIPIITPFLGKALGYKLAKPILSLITWILRFYRRIRNKQVS